MPIQVFNDNIKKEQILELIQGDQNDLHLKYLIKYLISNFNDENIFFLLYMDSFKKNPSIIFFNFIITNFITQGSAYQVNVSSAQREVLEKIYKTATPPAALTRGRRGGIISSFNSSTLDIAFGEIAALVARDPYKRFIGYLSKQTIPFQTDKYFIEKSSKYKDGLYYESNSAPSLDSKTWTKFDNFRNTTVAAGLLVPGALINVKKSDFTITTSTATTSTSSTNSYGW